LSHRSLILASGSPRRRELLAAAGYQFEVIPADVDELDYPAGTPPLGLAELLARRKASVISERYPEALVLGADTVVALGNPSGDGAAIGKPADEADAAAMLRRLGGTAHTVITGVCLMCTATGLTQTRTVQSTVFMKAMSDDEIARHIASGQWRGKAGGYGIQDQGADPFVMRQEGSQTNVVGLPMEVVSQMLGEAGVGGETGMTKKLNPNQ
jgi:septum formation protein